MQDDTKQDQIAEEVNVEEQPRPEDGQPLAEKTEESEPATSDVAPVDQPVTEPETPEETEVASESTQKEEEEATEPRTEDDQPLAEAKNDNPNAKWYVVHTYSGHENKVAATLKQRVESERLEEKILDVLVPVQDKIEIKNGKKATIKEKIFPGYILVKMVLDDESWLAVRTIQGVTSFVGIGNKPTPISNAEVQTIIKFTQNEHPVYKQVFSSNDTVKIIEGPFAEFIGKVDSVDEEKGKVKILVSIFGRETPVELDFLQVQKI